MACATIACLGASSAAHCLRARSKAGQKVSQSSDRMRPLRAARTFVPDTHFLRGRLLKSAVSRASTRLRMAAEPEVKETTQAEDGETPEQSAYEKELKVGKFNIKDVQERFAVKESGKHECNSCGYEYKPEEGDSSYPVSKGTQFGDLPEDWQCPICGASRESFVNKGVQLSGFVQNQGFGLGGNSLTSNQKSILIYGSLIFFFCLFLSGYFLQ